MGCHPLVLATPTARVVLHAQYRVGEVLEHIRRVYNVGNCVHLQLWGLRVGLVTENFSMLLDVFHLSVAQPSCCHFSLADPWCLHGIVQ